MSKLFAKLESFVNDITSLEVATFSNEGVTLENVNTTPATAPAEGDAQKATTSAIFEQVRAKLINQKLVGYVRFDIDGDTVSFLDSTANKDMLDYHSQMVTHSQNARQDLINSITNLVKGANIPS